MGAIEEVRNQFSKLIFTHDLPSCSVPLKKKFVKEILIFLSTLVR